MLVLPFLHRSHLGKISYGLYMFHPIAIVISIKIYLYVNILSNYFLYLLSMMLTTLIASISYVFFKIKFSSIVSGDNFKIKGDNQKNSIY